MKSSYLDSESRLNVSDSVAAVVVHHKSLATIGDTIGALTQAGLSPQNIVVVDNSEDQTTFDSLKLELPDEVLLAACPNDGYGAAVNFGVRYLDAVGRRLPFTLISTHESLPDEDAVAVLARVLADDDTLGVVGPLLITGSDRDVVWSAGGYLSRLLRVPRHRRHLEAVEHVCGSGGDAVRRVDWLDGAFLMYRSSVLKACAVDEDYFLYMEEVDHHLSLARHGYGVAIATDARVWQSSAGLPPYWSARNTYRFQRRHGSPLSRLLTPRYAYARTALAGLRHFDQRTVLRLRRLREGWNVRDMAPKEAGLVIVNPLEKALAHYVGELEATVNKLGVDTSVLATCEPSATGGGRVRWLARYVALLMKSRKIARKNGVRAPVIVTWPVLGYIDVLLVRVLAGPHAWVVMHDPRPLVRSAGYGRVVRWCVRLYGARWKMIVHSERALAHVREDSGTQNAINLPHPILHNSRGSDVTRTRDVRVFGQFKRDRDLSALEHIPKHCPSEISFEIHGRGWPEISGWRVRDKFIPETELDELLRSSGAVLIPYKRFYQSGIAIRCLENEVPFVGPADSSLSDLLEECSPLLVANGDWVSAVQAALNLPNDSMREFSRRYGERCLYGWQAWLRIVDGRPPSVVGREPRNTEVEASNDY